MSKIPTAEEMVVRWQNEVIKNMGTQNADVNSLENAFIAFAKLHVEAALKEVSKKGKCSNGTSVVIKDSILNSYPLENIK